MRLLYRLRKRGLVAQLVRGAGVVDALLRPRADDDLHLLGEELEPLLAVEEREAVLDVLALVPARAHPDLDAAVRDVVDRGRHAGEHARVAIGRGRDHRAEADAARERCESGERRPGVERVGLGADDRGVVVGAEEPLEPVALDEPGEAHPVVPGHALLPLDHQIEPHSASGSVTGALQTKRSQT
jgi:hypothetical protein